MGWKNEILCMAVLFSSMLLFAGCTQPQQPATSPQAQTGAGQEQAPLSTARQQQPSQPPATQPQAQPAPSQGSCYGMSGDNLIQCVYAQAVASKDVTICTSLGEQNGRFICIAQWCGSAARDYRQCDRLTNYDDNLGCLSKCNPNPNT